MLDYSGPTHTDPTVYINFPYKTNEGPKLHIYMYIGLTVFAYYNTNEWILRFHKPICILPIFFTKQMKEFYDLGLTVCIYYLYNTNEVTDDKAQCST